MSVLKENVSFDTPLEMISKWGFDPATLSNFYANHMTPARMQAGGGGCQILTLGDSLFAGTDVTNRARLSIPGVLRNLLRRQFGQDPGTSGFVPCRYQSATLDTNPATVVTNGSTAVADIALYTVAGCQGYRLPESSTATPSAISFTMTNCTKAPQIVLAVRDSQVVSSNGTSVSGTWTLTAPGGFSKSGTFVYQADTGLDYQATIRPLSGVGDLNANTTYTLTLSGKVSGTNNATSAWVAGIITYGREWDSGIRVYNLASTGTTLYDDGSNSQGMYNANATGDDVILANNVTLFCSSNSATSGSTRTGLVISDWGINDQGHYGATIPNSYGNIGTAAVASSKHGDAVYRSYLCRFIEELRNQTSNPSVLLVDLPIAQDRGPQLRLFQLAKQQACEIMGAGYMNFSKLYSPGDRTLTIPSGWDADSIHLTEKGYGVVGTDIAQAIYSGYLWYNNIGRNRVL